jgi:hypothetical protein
VLFISLTAPICFVLMFFGYRSTKKQWSIGDGVVVQN